MSTSEWAVHGDEADHLHPAETTQPARSAPPPEPPNTATCRQTLEERSAAVILPAAILLPASSEGQATRLSFMPRSGRVKRIALTSTQPSPAPSSSARSEKAALDMRGRAMEGAGWEERERSAAEDGSVCVAKLAWTHVTILGGYSHLQSTQSVKSSDWVRLGQTASDCFRLLRLGEHSLTQSAAV